MILSNQLENDSTMAPVAQEAEVIELNLEQLEGIQGGRFSFRNIFRAVQASVVAAVAYTAENPIIVFTW